MFSEYNEVSVKFQLLECGVRLLYEDGIRQFDLIMSGFSRFHPLDGDGLEARFQATRARFQGMRWDYSVMHRTSEFLASLQSDHLFLGYDPCLNATKDFWYGNFSEVSVEFSVEDMDTNPLHYCHVSKCGVRQLYTQAENYFDFILPYCKFFAATPTEFRQLVQQLCGITQRAKTILEPTNAGVGKNKRCHDNKRDNEAEPGGSGFKNGAESTTNDLKVYSRRPKRFKEIK
uniref:Uncharacterized protein n=1 Tax=Populus alba TaxID=43335 RepID=A0A4U5NLN0_POPAL|nr:hypothetical protein D5086_0000257380 [Populus alba]